MSDDKRRAFRLLDESGAISGKRESLPPDVTGMRVYGTGLPPQGVIVSREDYERGAVVYPDPPPSSKTIGG